MKPERILPQQLMAACGQYVEAKAAAIELNNLYEETERLTAENKRLYCQKDYWRDKAKDSISEVEWLNDRIDVLLEETRRAE